MDDVTKFMRWLELHGTSAPWEQVQQRFQQTFRLPRVKDGDTLSGLLISNRGLPLYGKTQIK